MLKTSDDFVDFIIHLDSDLALQEKVSKCINSQEIFKIAIKLGYKIGVNDFLYSKENIEAPYWPWSNQKFR